MPSRFPSSAFVIVVVVSATLLCVIMFAPDEATPPAPTRAPLPAASRGPLLPIDHPAQGPVTLAPPRPAADRAFPALLESPSVAVRSTAIAQLSATSNAEAADALLAHLSRETDPEALLALVIAVKRTSRAHRPQRAAAALAARFDAGDAKLRGAILAAFALYPSPSDLPTVHSLAARAANGEETRKITDLLARLAAK